MPTYEFPVHEVRHDLRAFGVASPSLALDAATPLPGRGTPATEPERRCVSCATN